MTMPRLLVPLPPKSMVPADANPFGDDRLPLVVSISTPMPVSTPVLAMLPGLVTLLLELMVIAGSLARAIRTAPAAGPPPSPAARPFPAIPRTPPPTPAHCPTQPPQTG